MTWRRWNKYPREPEALCPLCKKPRTVTGQDPCISNLPGVQYACCGHGKELGYLMLDNGVTIYGIFGHMVKRRGLRPAIHRSLLSLLKRARP